MKPLSYYREIVRSNRNANLRDLGMIPASDSAVEVLNLTKDAVEEDKAFGMKVDDILDIIIASLLIGMCFSVVNNTILTKTRVHKLRSAAADAKIKTAIANQLENGGGIPLIFKEGLR